jgi:nucleotide-binding universal stress UspA family protein
MPKRTRDHRAGHEAGRSTPHGFHSLLIPIDLSPATERILGRATLLPLAQNAQLTLLHVVPKLLPREARRRAERDAEKALQLAARNVARQLPKSVQVTPSIRVGVAAAEITRHARSRKAELIVMGRGGGRALRDIFLGSTAERVIRRGQLPVLVVRLPPREAYRRPMLALDTSRAAHAVVAMALRVLAAPRPSIGLVHAYDAPYHDFIYPSLAADLGREYRNYYRRKALRDITRTVATALMEAKSPRGDVPSWKTYVRYGSPRTVIPDTVAKAAADLLVLGTHGHAGVAHAFLGSVAGDVLRDVPCDVLVVPPGTQGSPKN